MSRAVFCWAKDIYVCRFFSFIKGKRKKWSFSASQISQQVMVHGIIEWSLRNRYIVLIMVAGLFVWGAFSVKNNPVDAIPDLSENQVIVFTEWMGRGPQLIEDQVTYPLVTNLQGLPRIRYVRGSSMFGMSFIYVIFEDDVDIYWARQRVLERLSTISRNLPQGVSPQLGPDGTGVGHILWYTLDAPNMDLGEQR